MRSQRVVFFGATQGMGRAFARRLAVRGDRLFLLGRRAEDLDKAAADLRARAGRDDAVIGHSPCDLGSPKDFAPALQSARDALGGGFDVVVITAGIFETQDAMEADIDKAKRLLDLDFTHTVLFCEHARKHLLESGGGSLVVFSSVAGDRGRKPVAIYGAAKAGLSRYLEALDHKFRGEGLHTLDVKPGFVHTAMTAGLKAPPFAGRPEQVAEDVERALDAGKPLLYTPLPWRFVMLVIRFIPRVVMRRLGF
ncbi:MAG: SDR family NAD(P)-dependent oxidoreductase [Acidobacteriota bacterium]